MVNIPNYIIPDLVARCRGKIKGGFGPEGGEMIDEGVNDIITPRHGRSNWGT